MKYPTISFWIMSEYLEKSFIVRIYVARPIFLLALLFFAVSLKGIVYPDRPDPFLFVHDFTSEKNFLSKSFRESLSEYLTELYRKKGIIFAVVIVEDLQGQDISSYATGLLNAWQLGTKGKDNGLLMLIKPKSAMEKGSIFIATGYGLEGDLPDIYLGHVLRETILPEFSKENYGEGVRMGVLNIVRKLYPDFEYEHKGVTEKDVTWKDIMMLLLVLFIILFLRYILPASGGIILGSGGSIGDSGGGWIGGGSSGGGISFGGRGGGGGAGGSW